MSNDYIHINKQLWNARTPHHVQSDFYRMDDFKNGWNSLDDFVLKNIGEVNGQNILHLQCHFGQDSLSLARMGAEVTGFDLSEKSVETARQLAEEMQLPAKFEVTDVMDAEHLVTEQYDKVFTSYGAICWLPELDTWAKLIKKALTPSGELVMVEFHPMLYMFNHDNNQLEFSYFNGNPYIEDEEVTYTGEAVNEEVKSVTWSHSISEIIAALDKVGLKIKSFNEYDHAPYNCFPNMREIGERKYRYGTDRARIPHVLAIRAGQ